MVSRAIPARLIYVVFAVALLVATFPAWRLSLFVFNPTLDELLQLRCFGL
jgi:hypothetical protein